MLPVRANIAKFSREADDLCPICKNEMETESHLFFDCTFATAIWFASPLALHHNYWAGLNTVERLHLMLRQDPRHNLNSGEWRLWSAIILDQIWRTRNALVHEGSVPNAIACMERCKSRWFEFQSSRQESSGLEARNDASFWTPSPGEFIKINVDALVDDNTASTGIVARSDDGSVLGIQVFLGPKVAIEEAEAVAIKKCILLALNERWKKVIIESDCFVVVEEWRAQNSDSLWSAAEILD